MPRRCRCAVVLALVAVATTVAAPARAREALPAAVHVHSSLSTGTRSLDELATAAERQGVGALFLAENYLLRIEYGVPPFRALTRVAYEERSVLGTLPEYLARVADARARHPHVVLVPGVEVMPHYFWTGTPLAFDVTLHDTQKNLLVFGLADADALARLPVIGNPHVRQLGLQSLLDALPVALVVPGVVLLARRRARRVRLGAAVIVVRRRRWLLGGAVLAVGVLALVRGWPFTIDRYPPWSSFGLEPHQAVIDEVERRGGVSMWSFPEAPDRGVREVGPVRVRWVTEPSPDDLLRSSGYTAFGAVYEQPTRFARVGGGWDRLLGDYAAGARGRPVWGVAESGFHAERAGKRLAAVQTVLLVDERSEAGALDAMRRGRMYARRSSGGATLVLTDFAVVAPGGTARMGDTLTVPAATPLDVEIALDGEAGGAHAVRVSLVKDGQVAAAWTGTTPLRVVHHDVAPAQRGFYRVEAVVSSSDYVLGNPVFVGP